MLTKAATLAASVYGFILRRGRLKVKDRKGTVNKTVALHNLGCKVNAYELDAMGRQLAEAGFSLVPFAPGADVYVINTCTVTNIADRKSRQLLHRAKKMNPEALVVAVGCYVQTKGEELVKDPAIDLLIGSSGKTELARRIREWFEAREKAGAPASENAAEGSGKEDAPASENAAERSRKEDSPSAKQLLREDISRDRNYENLWVERPSERVRAFLKVQDGCDQFCSYCVIPLARGRVRCRPAEEAVAETRRLADSGCREVVLTGIHLGSYGEGLADLISQVAAVPGIERVRLGSLEPGTITDEFLERIKGIPELCPHFHLSLQSGCDRTLRLMRRRYTTAEFRQAAERLRAVFSEPSLTTDIIVGFPGESEEDFAESLRFVDGIGFFETHIFPYSRRDGTAAAALPDQIPEAVKRRRRDAFLELNEKKRAEALPREIGKEARVLVEDRERIGGKPYWTGHTERYHRVLFEDDRELAGSFINLRIYDILEGELVGKEESE